MLVDQLQNPTNENNVSSEFFTLGRILPQILINPKEIAIYCGSPSELTWGEVKASHNLLVFIFSCSNCNLRRLNTSKNQTESSMLRENHLYTIQAGASYSMAWNKGSFLILYVPKHYSPASSINSLFKHPFSDLGSLISLARKNPIITQLPILIRHCCNSDASQYKNLISESAKIIFKLVSAAAQMRAQNGRRSDCLSQKQFDIIETYMMQHPDMKSDVATLARLLSLSDGQFMRLFKNTMNTSVMDYYGRLRIPTVSGSLII